MSLPKPSVQPADPPEAAARSLFERQMARLERLADIGMLIAEAAGRRALADDDGAGVADAGLSYTRAARAVRLTLALQTRLSGDMAAFERGQAATRAAEAGRRRDRIHARVEQAIEAERCDPDEVETLSSQVWERLTDPDDADLLSGPIDEVVARICQDLGLSPAWAAADFPAPGAEPLVMPSSAGLSLSKPSASRSPQGITDPPPWAESLATKAAPAWATNGDRSGP